MRTPCQSSDSIFVPRQYSDRSSPWHPYIKCPYKPIHTRCRYNAVSILVPVMGQRLTRWYTNRRSSTHTRLWWCVYRHTHREVIARACRRPEIKNPQMTITANTAHNTRRVRTELRTVGAAMCRQCGNTSIMIRVPNLDCAIP